MAFFDFSMGYLGQKKQIKRMDWSQNIEKS